MVNVSSPETLNSLYFRRSGAGGANFFVVSAGSGRLNCQTFHQTAKAFDVFLNVDQLHGVPDASKAAGDYGFANFSFEQGDIGDRALLVD